MSNLEPRKSELTMRQLLVTSIKIIAGAPIVMCMLFLMAALGAYVVSLLSPTNVGGITIIVVAIVIFMISIVYDIHTDCFKISSIGTALSTVVRVMTVLKMFLAVFFCIGLIIYCINYFTGTDLTQHVSGLNSVRDGNYSLVNGTLNDFGIILVLVVYSGSISAYSSIFNNVIVHKVTGDINKVPEHVLEKAVVINHYKIIMHGMFFILLSPTNHVAGLLMMAYAILYVVYMTVMYIDIWDVPKKKKEEKQEKSIPNSAILDGA